VYDGLPSFPSVGEAVDLMRRTQKALKVGGNIRLHKIASNSQEVVEAFPANDRADMLKELSLYSDILPNHRSLGLVWNMQTDHFTFEVDNGPKPYKRRGVLSTINSLFVHTLQRLCCTPSLQCLEPSLQVVRQATRCELHTFCDASEKAITAVVYIQTVDQDGLMEVGFVLWKAKIAHSHGHTILETVCSCPCN
jgi:hypothetical protein